LTKTKIKKYTNNRDGRTGNARLRVPCVREGKQKIGDISVIFFSGTKLASKTSE